MNKTTVKYRSYYAEIWSPETKDVIRVALGTFCTAMLAFKEAQSLATEGYRVVDVDYYHE